MEEPGPLILDPTVQAHGEKRKRPREIDKRGPLILDPTVHIESRAARLKPRARKGRRLWTVDREMDGSR